MLDLSSLKNEVERRRNFAIISHPDAGKTTLTEKLLLYGGAIHEAGTVKNRRTQRSVTSDWMALEQQRGISITSTVLQFDYKGYKLNLLDTPGHHDFSEDTYRTLTAADNAVMLIDAAKGLETRTRKLFEVCRMRDIPIFTFINKLDRPSRDPLELLDEIESELGLSVYAVNWAIGTGDTFQGVYNRRTEQVHLYERNPHGQRQAKETIISLHDSKLASVIGDKQLRQLKDDSAILSGAGAQLNEVEVLQGKTSPVFFGSAMTNFGVESFLQEFLKLAAPPAAHLSNIGEIQPTYSEFSGFVFKLQANMDPRHRDCLAFVRICSGKFTKDMTVTNSRTAKTLRLARPQKVFARERESLEEAFPGDIIGFNNPGAFAISDTIYTGQKLVYPRIPSFTPELFAKIRNPNTSLAKKFQKGITQLEEEGAVQILYAYHSGDSQGPVLAAIGELQFEVAQYRLTSEYGVETKLDLLPYKVARWVTAGWEVLLGGDQLYETDIYRDRWQQPVLLFRSQWHLERVEKDRPELKLSPIDTF